MAIKRQALPGTRKSRRSNVLVGSPVKRDNHHDYVTASPPTQTNSESIHNDGTDFSYFAGIDFGSSRKTMYMLVDTGAANTWVMGSDCKTQVCAEHNTLGPSDSTSLKVSSDPFDLTYGTGSVSGFTGNDNVQIAGISVRLPFGLASKVSDDFLTYPMDGILGLGPPASKSMDFPTAMETVQKAKALSSNLFGVNLQRSSDGSTDGELSFGAPDITKFQGDLSYTEIVAGASMWEIPIDDAKVNGHPCTFTGKSAIIDTDATKLHGQIPGSQEDGETFNIPCASKTPIQILFSGVSYNISPVDYVGSPIQDGSSTCASNIIGRRAFGEDQWLIGDLFLKNVYSVFDYDKERIGFATKASKSSSTSTQVSHPTSSPGFATSSYRSPSAPTASAENPSLVGNTASPSVSTEPKDSPTSAAVSIRLRHRVHTLRRPLPERRQSSLSQSKPDGLPRTPRTTNRVRFEVEDRESSELEQNGRIAEPASRPEEEDYFSYDTSADGRRSISQRAPLLTGIEAPSVTIATTDLDFTPEDLLESSRPKSGMRSAFINMANSIMYVCNYYDNGNIL
ncbi:MAG: hypothetical protein Q9225_002782 [Loekoesia sp. 1 TL-2023]